MPLITSTPFNVVPSTTWSIAGASFSSSFDVSSQSSVPVSVKLRADNGTKMYVQDFSTDQIYQYSLSTPWTVSAGSASYDSVSANLTTLYGINVTIQTIFIKPDGTKLYALDNGNDVVSQFSMSPPWDLSTLSYDSVAFSVTVGTGSLLGLAFRTSDGAKMYVARDDDNIYQYSLPTPWSVSTVNYDSVFLDVSSETGAPQDIELQPDGKRLFVTTTDNADVYQYSITNANDISTGSYDSVFVDVSGKETGPFGLTFRPSGASMYICGNSSASVHQYNL